MEEIFSEYIGVIAFLLFMVLPRLLRKFNTRGGRTPTPAEQTLEDLLQGEVNLPQQETEAELVARWEALAEVTVRLNTVQTKAAELSELCRKRGGTAARLLPGVLGDEESDL